MPRKKKGADARRTTSPDQGQFPEGAKAPPVSGSASVGAPRAMEGARDEGPLAVTDELCENIHRESTSSGMRRLARAVLDARRVARELQEQLQETRAEILREVFGEDGPAKRVRDAEADLRDACSEVESLRAELAETKKGEPMFPLQAHEPPREPRYRVAHAAVRDDVANEWLTNEQIVERLNAAEKEKPLP